MRRMRAADYKNMAAAFPEKKKPKKQQESLDQKAYVKALNKMGIGFFFRVKNMGTFDPIRRSFRKNNELVAIPDILGFLKNGRFVCIEVKRVIKVEKKKKLIFKVKITEKQIEFLLDAHRNNCLSGVAFNIADCISIVMNDKERYPRHPRTYAFLPKVELEQYAEDYQLFRREHGEAAKDPMVNNVYWAVK